MPCSLCASRAQQNQADLQDRAGHEGDGRGRGGEEVHYFNMEDCVLAAVEKENITCPQHPEQPVPLQELVPELFMTDFPAR